MKEPFTFPPREVVIQMLTLGTYGSFLALWSTFDIVVEIILLRQLRLTVEEASIVFSSLNFGAKMNILVSLLNREPADTTGITLLKNVQTKAERNSFAHGFFRVDADRHTFALIRREVKDRYVVRRKRYGFKEADNHLQDFIESLTAVDNHFNVTEHDKSDFGRQIEEHVLAQEAQGKTLPEFPTSSEKAKKK